MMEFDSRKITDVVIKMKEDNSGSYEVTNLRLFIKGISGNHITSFNKGEKVFCDCIAYKTRGKCIHLVVTETVINAANVILPTLELNSVFQKAEQAKEKDRKIE